MGEKRHRLSPKMGQNLKVDVEALARTLALKKPDKLKFRDLDTIVIVMTS